MSEWPGRCNATVWADRLRVLKQGEAAGGKKAAPAPPTSRGSPPGWVEAGERPGPSWRGRGATGIRLWADTGNRALGSDGLSTPAGDDRRLDEGQREAAKLHLPYRASAPSPRERPDQLWFWARPTTRRGPPGPRAGRAACSPIYLRRSGRIETTTPTRFRSS